MTLAASDGALLDLVRGVRWPARRAAPGGIAGAHSATTRGTSAEFTEHRPYRQGDDPHRIDWKLLARSDRVAVRLSNDRAPLGTVLLVDASSSMAFPEPGHEKWAFARQLAIGLAAAAHHSGDPVGVTVATADGAVRLPSRMRPGAVQDVARLLADVRPGGNAPLAPLLEELRRVPRVAIVTDLLGDADALHATAATLVAAGREMHLVHIVHPLEVDPPEDTAAYVDPERPQLRRVLSRETHSRYRAAFREWRAEMARAWWMAGAYYTEVITSEAPERAVRRVATPGPVATGATTR